VFIWCPRRLTRLTWLMRLMRLFRPGHVGVDAHIGHARQARLDMVTVAGQQLGRDARAHLEDHLLALGLGLHGLGRELRDAGHMRHLRRDDVLRGRIQHQAGFGAHGQAAHGHLGQEEGHLHVTEVGQGQHAATGAQHLARLRGQHLHPAIARGAQHGVIAVGLHAVQRRLRGRHGRVGLHHLRLRGRDRRAGLCHLRLRRAVPRLGALHLGLHFIELLRRQEALVHQLLRALQLLLRQVELGLALAHHGLCGGHGLLALGQHRVCREAGIAGLGQLRTGALDVGVQHGGVHGGQHLAGVDVVAFTHQQGLEPATGAGGDVHFRGLDAAIAAGDALRQPGRLEAMPDQPGAPRQRGGDQPQQPGAALPDRGRGGGHVSCFLICDGNF
jgi:hypothetical protein